MEEGRRERGEMGEYLLTNIFIFLLWLNYGYNYDYSYKYSYNHWYKLETNFLNHFKFYN